MRRKGKKMTACVLTILLGLSVMNFPVHAQETQMSQQVENAAISITDTESLPVLQSMFKTAVNALTTLNTNAGPFNVTGDTDGWTYDAASKTLTFTKDGNYKVTGDTQQTDIQIVIVPNITITLTVKDVNCHPSGAGMSIDGSATATLMLEGNNKFEAGKANNAGIEFNDATTGSLTIDGSGSSTLFAASSDHGAGIGGSTGQSGKNITINGGKVTVPRGEGGAGIGGGETGNGENITINGGIVTINKAHGAGIGGGYGGSAKNITITGGTLTAFSILGTGIGDGSAGTGSSDIVITGGSVKANGGKGTISGTPTDGNGKPVYLAKMDITDNAEQIKVDGKDYKIEGKHETDTAYYLYMTEGNHYIETDSNVYKTEWDTATTSFKTISTPIKTGDLKVTGGTYGIDYIYDEVKDTLNFNADGNYTVTGNGYDTKEQIVIGGGLTLKLTVNNVNCNPNGAGMSIDGSSTVTLMLEGENVFVAGNKDNAGIEFNNAVNGSLTIDGSGLLDVETLSGAGIGGSKGENGRNIIIAGGEIYTFTEDGAMIGGGSGAAGNNYVEINGGRIEGSSTNGAGIGSGSRATGDNDIKITGGNIQLTSNNGAAIGGGNNATGANNITISGGYVNANSNANVAIGSNSGIEYNITISGGTIDTGAAIEYDIGSKNSSDPGIIRIFGGSVNAYSISKNPVNSNDELVYLAKLNDQDGINEVKVDGELFKREGDNSDSAFSLYLTGKDHHIESNGKKYKAIWNSDDSTFTVKPIAPTPTSITTTQTASTITVTEPADADTYGDVAYSINNKDWQASKEFTNLDSSTSYTVYVKYKGNEKYADSEVAQTTVATSSATYTITIPQTANAGGQAVDISVYEDKDHPFDIGANGKVNVKIKDGITNGNLTLTRNNASNTITSALLVGGKAFVNVQENIATFTMANKAIEKASISFAKPTQTSIPAGTYSGRVTFEVTYSQSGG